MNQYIFTFCHDWIDWFGMSCIQICLFTKRHEKFPVVAFKYACTSRQKNSLELEGMGQSSTGTKQYKCRKCFIFTLRKTYLFSSVFGQEHAALVLCLLYQALASSRFSPVLGCWLNWHAKGHQTLLTLCRLLSALVANSEGPLLASLDTLCTNMSPFRFVHHWQHWSARPKPIARFSGALPHAC